MPAVETGKIDYKLGALDQILVSGEAELAPAASFVQEVDDFFAAQIAKDVDTLSVFQTIQNMQRDGKLTYEPKVSEGKPKRVFTFETNEDLLTATLEINFSPDRGARHVGAIEDIPLSPGPKGIITIFLPRGEQIVDQKPSISYAPSSPNAFLQGELAFKRIVELTK